MKKIKTIKLWILDLHKFTIQEQEWNIPIDQFLIIQI